MRRFNLAVALFCSLVSMHITDPYSVAVIIGLAALNLGVGLRREVVS